MRSFFFKIMMLCVCVWFLIMSLPDFLSGSLSMTWPKTQGMVLEKFLSKKTTGKVTLWKPVVEYTYQVEDRTYSGEKISFSMFIFSEQWAVDRINRYNINSKVDVFYNPFNHKISCLDPGPEIAATFYSTIGMGGLLYLLFSFYHTPKSRNVI